MPLSQCVYIGYCGTTRQHCYRGAQLGYGDYWPQDPNCSTFFTNGTCGYGGTVCCPSDLCCRSVSVFYCCVCVCVYSFSFRRVTGCKMRGGFKTAAAGHSDVRGVCFTELH